MESHDPRNPQAAIVCPACGGETRLTVPLDSDAFELRAGKISERNAQNVGKLHSNSVGGKAEAEVALVARICVRCGLANLYALDPGKLA